MAYTSKSHGSCSDRLMASSSIDSSRFCSAPPSAAVGPRKSSFKGACRAKIKSVSPELAQHPQRRGHAHHVLFRDPIYPDHALLGRSDFEPWVDESVLNTRATPPLEERVYACRDD